MFFFFFALLVEASLRILHIAEELAVHSFCKPKLDIASLLDAIAVVLVAPVVCGCVTALCHLKKADQTVDGETFVDTFCLQIAMNEKRKPVRIVCRKLPPTMTEDDFRNIDCVRAFLDEGKMTLRFYPEYVFGETAAPPSATAVATFPQKSHANQFAAAMAEKTFEAPFTERVHIAVELAPLQSRMGNMRQPVKQLPSIDEDSEFQKFAAAYEAGLQQSEGRIMTVEELEKSAQCIDNEEMVREFSERINAKPVEKKRKMQKKRKNGRHRY